MRTEYYGIANIRKEEIGKGNNHSDTHYFLDIYLTFISPSGQNEGIPQITLPLDSYHYEELLEELEHSSSNRFNIKRGNLELITENFTENL